MMAMTKLNNIPVGTDKDIRIESERAKLTEQFKGIDERRKKTVEKLIDNAAWLSATLEDVRKSMDAKGMQGLISEYQNGENQWGTKKSPEVEVYANLISNYSKIVGQLTSMMPEEIHVNKEDKDLKAMKEFLG